MFAKIACQHIPIVAHRLLILNQDGTVRPRPEFASLDEHLRRETLPAEARHSNNSVDTKSWNSMEMRELV